MAYIVTATWTSRTRGGERRFRDTYHEVPDRETAERLAKDLVEAKSAHHTTFEEVRPSV